jgi:hypothetical protein
MLVNTVHIYLSIYVCMYMYVGMHTVQAMHNTLPYHTIPPEAIRTNRPAVDVTLTPPLQKGSSAQQPTAAIDESRREERVSGVIPVRSK